MYQAIPVDRYQYNPGTMAFLTLLMLPISEWKRFPQNRIFFSVSNIQGYSVWLGALWGSKDMIAACIYVCMSMYSLKLYSITNFCCTFSVPTFCESLIVSEIKQFMSHHLKCWLPLWQTALQLNFSSEMLPTRICCDLLFKRCKTTEIVSSPFKINLSLWFLWT